MRTLICVIVLLMFGEASARAQNDALAERRHRAAAAFHDGILLVHASSAMDISTDSFRQDPYFFYFAGLENTVGAVLAIDGKTGESWLFLPPNPPFGKSGLIPEIQPGSDAAGQHGFEHVADWSELEAFLKAQGSAPGPLYYVADFPKFAELPAQLLSSATPGTPTWLQIILQKWPALRPRNRADNCRH